MAKTYWISFYRAIHDPEKLAAYAKLAGPALQGAGGRFLARGLPAKVYELGLEQRTVVVEFASVAQAIIALSHSLGLRCTAEGVETNAQYNFLRVHGCEEAQGYLITEPLAETEFRIWWDAHATEFASAQRQRDLWQSRVG